MQLDSQGRSGEKWIQRPDSRVCSDVARTQRHQMLVQLKSKSMKALGVSLFPLNSLVTELQSPAGHGARQWEWNRDKTGEGELPLI